MACLMQQMNLSIKRIIALVVVTQLLTIMFFSDFHLGMGEHELGEKPHIHLSLNEHDHHQDTDHIDSLEVYAESLLHEHDHASEIHIHLNLIEADPTVQALLNLPVSEAFVSFNSAISSFGQKPLLPPPTA